MLQNSIIRILYLFFLDLNVVALPRKSHIFVCNNQIHMKANSLISKLLSIIAAVILLQTLYFKFTAHPQSIRLFTSIGAYIHWYGANPYMRIGTGVMELIAGILLLVPSVRFLGALMSLGVISGAIATHLLIPTVGVNFGGDPWLFIMAVIVFVCSFILLIIHKDQGLTLYQQYIKKSK